MIKRRPYILVLLWALAIFSVLAITYSYTGKTNIFFGLASSSKVKTVSYDTTVVVENIFLNEGESFDAGDTIAIFNNLKLEQELETIKTKILQINTKTEIEILKLKNDQIRQTSLLDNKIELSKSKYKINKSILNSNHIWQKNNYLSKSIKILKHELDSLNKLYDNSINSIKQQNKQIVDELELKYKRLKTKQNNLKLIAPFDGIVSKIYFKNTEEVPAFEPIIMIQSHDIDIVNAFIDEKLTHDLKIDQKVKISTLTNNKSTVVGKVLTIGEAIVEYPQRLKKNLLLKTWGHQILISLPKHHNISFGQKVKIEEFSGDNLLGFSLFANEKTTLTNKKQKIRSTKPIEASSVIYDKMRNNFIVVTDELTDGKTKLAIMNKDGKVQRWQDIDIVMDDIEAIDKSDQFIFVSSSLSATKSNKYKKKRQLLTKLSKDFKVLNSINLFELLKNSNSEEPLLSFIKNSIDEKTIDIESMIYFKDRLILGFKSPFGKDGEVYLVDIGHIDDIFDKNITQHQIKLFKKLKLKKRTKLSDMKIKESSLYFVAVEKKSKSKKDSYLFKTELNSDKVVVLAHFKNAKAEGLCQVKKSNRFLIVFDGGKNGSSYTYFEE